ncbi:unnamed protein product [Cuscuta epithymum]|uniref:Ty3 transposon capsid-like protein domain-containing protein n=1 Tax=Cuscuta epithymum TaxID=186058 RepID=A0AAV0DF18_9ASTE|nr:unnamed protein product [Cuscuta epithymum]
MPIFNGEDVCGWLLRMNRYFRLNNTEDEDKIDVAVIAMEDQALSWFQWWEGQAQHQNWESFTHALTRRFQPNLVQDPLGLLFSLKQKGTIQEYRDQFETAIASHGHLTEEVLKGVFLKGLKRDIRAELKLHSARTLAEVMEKVSLIENKNTEVLFMKNREEGKNKGQSKYNVQNSGQNWSEGSRWKSHPDQPVNMGKVTIDNKSYPEVMDPNQKRNGPRLSQED